MKQSVFVRNMKFLMWLMQQSVFVRKRTFILWLMQQSVFTPEKCSSEALGTYIGFSGADLNNKHLQL